MVLYDLEKRLLAELHIWLKYWPRLLQNSYTHVLFS